MIESLFKEWFIKKYNREPDLTIEHDRYLFQAFKAGALLVQELHSR